MIRGQAREVTCVDLDEKAVALARENGNANSVRLSVVHADAYGYMRQMALNQRTFGVVVLDPPKLIIDRDEVSAGKRKYFDLNVLGMGLVEPGGLLLTCSCSGLLPAPDFQALLRAAARKAGRSVQLLAMTGASADHPVALDAPKSPTSRPPGSGLATRSLRSSPNDTGHALSTGTNREPGMRGCSLDDVAKTSADASDSWSFPILSAWPSL